MTHIASIWFTTPTGDPDTTLQAVDIDALNKLIQSKKAEEWGPVGKRVRACKIERRHDGR